MIRNSSSAWGWPAKALHWISAVAIVVLLAHGWWMTHMTARPDRLANYAWHAALGYDLLMITVLRLVWRLFNDAPALPPDTKGWERAAAHAGHVGLYVLMVVTLVTGWVLATTFRAPMTGDLFGLKIPAIITSLEKATRDLIEGSHEVLAYLTAALVVVHIAGALRHHVLKRNEVLVRMLP